MEFFFFIVSKNGDSDARLYLSYAYYYGMFCKRSDEEAKKWLNLAKTENKIANARTYYMSDNYIEVFHSE